MFALNRLDGWFRVFLFFDRYQPEQRIAERNAENGELKQKAAERNAENGELKQKAAGRSAENNKLKQRTAGRSAAGRKKRLPGKTGILKKETL